MVHVEFFEEGGERQRQDDLCVCQCVCMCVENEFADQGIFEEFREVKKDLDESANSVAHKYKLLDSQGVYDSVQKVNDRDERRFMMRAEYMPVVLTIMR